MGAYQMPNGGVGIDALVMVEQPNPKAAYRQVIVRGRGGICCCAPLN
jgi:hypothetical protein